MDVYAFISQNRELFKLIYAALVILICFVVVLKTNRLYHLSLHSGIRYFRNAFLFYGLAFFSRYILTLIDSAKRIGDILFEFFAIVAGFFLLYSLIWRKIDARAHPHSSLFNFKVLVFYVMAAIIVLIDVFWATTTLLFISQIILFFIAAIISFINYKNKFAKNKYSGFYFFAMLLAFGAWILNYLAASFWHWNIAVLINIYFFNTIFFVVILYGIFKIRNQ